MGREVRGKEMEFWRKNGFGMERKGLGAKKNKGIGAPRRIWWQNIKKNLG